MSYNLDTVNVILNENLRIRGDVLAILMEEIEDDLPEACFLYGLPRPGKTHNNAVWPKEPLQVWSPLMEER